MEKKKLALLLALVFLGVLILGWFFRDALQNFFTTPQEPLPQVIVGSYLDARLYEVAGKHLKEVHIASEGSVTSRARRSEFGSASSVFLPPGTLGNEIVLENYEGSRVLSLPFSVKDTPALSFSGTYLAYAELSPEHLGMLYSEDVDAWRIQVVNLRTNTTTDLGTGFAPHFISEQPLVVLFSTPNGVVSANLDSGERTLFEEFPVRYTPHAAHASPDGALLAVHNPVTSHYAIFSIQDADSFEVDARGEVPVLLSPVALSNSALFGVQRDEVTNVFSLWQYSVKNLKPLEAVGTLLFTFEEGIIPYQLVP